MTMTIEPLVPVSHLCDLADWYPRSVLPRESSHRSLPIPCADPRGVRIAFLFSKAQIDDPKEGLRIWPPCYEAFHDPRTGRFLKLRPTVPADFGLKHAIDTPLGVCLTPGQLAAPDYLSWKAGWYQALDVLLPLFMSRASKLMPEDLAMIVEFKELFARISEPPLLPYYHSVGGEFFAWLYAMDPGRKYV